MLSLLLVAAAAQSPPSEPTKPAIKTCPDGSAIYASLECATLPDHRYVLDHEPKVQIKAVEWWCGPDRQPSRVRVEVRQRDDAGPGRKSYDLRLVALSNRGGPASQSVRRQLEQELATLNGIGSISGRCLTRRGSGVRAILHLQGYQEGVREPRRVEIEIH